MRFALRMQAALETRRTGTVLPSGRRQPEAHLRDAIPRPDVEAEPRQTLGASLRRARQARGLRQVDLARRIGRRQSVISRWESGRLTPVWLDLRSLAAALEVDLADLLATSQVAVDPRVRSSRAHSADARLAAGSALRSARVAARWDPIDLWRLCGVTPYRLSRLERGFDGPLDELVALLRAVGLLDGGPGVRPKLDKRQPAPNLASPHEAPADGSTPGESGAEPTNR